MGQFFAMAAPKEDRSIATGAGIAPGCSVGIHDQFVAHSFLLRAFPALELGGIGVGVRTDCRQDRSYLDDARFKFGEIRIMCGCL